MEGAIQVIPKERKMRSLSNKILPSVILFDGYLTAKKHCSLSWKCDLLYLYKIALLELVCNIGNKITLKPSGSECWHFFGIFF